MEGLGFGTAYETAIFRESIDRLVKKYQIKRVLEYPITNLLNDFQYKASTGQIGPPETNHDLVWSFCHFEQNEDSDQFIDDLADKTNRYLLMAIQNNRNPGLTLHWFYHKIIGKEWDHGKIGKMSPKKLRKAVTKNNFTILEDDFHDLPWFILDVYECGHFLKKLVPRSLLNEQDVKPSKFEGWPRIIKSFLAHHYQVLAEKSKS